VGVKVGAGITVSPVQQRSPWHSTPLCRGAPRAFPSGSDYAHATVASVMLTASRDTGNENFV